MQGILASTKISGFLNEHPVLTDCLMELGLCRTRTDVGPENSMGWELSRAAAEKDLDLQTLLVEFNGKTPR